MAAPFIDQLDLATAPGPGPGDWRPPGSFGRWKICHVDVDAPLPHGFSRTCWFDGSFSVLAESGNSRRYLVSFAGAAQFLIDCAGREIWIHDKGSYAHQSIRHLLNDQVFPRILAHEGELVLHAAGVTAGDGAVLFIGASGSGKSSLATAMHNWGFRLLGDDAIIASTDGNSAARAVYRSLRLFPDSIAALVHSSAEVTAVATYTSKQNVGYPDDRLSAQALPIRAAFLLDPAGSENVAVKALSASEACMAFVEHSFWMDPTDLSRTKQRMTKASALAVSVPAFLLTYPRDYSVLPAVHDAVMAVLH